MRPECQGDVSQGKIWERKVRPGQMECEVPKEGKKGQTGANGM